MAYLRSFASFVALIDRTRKRRTRKNGDPSVRIAAYLRDQTATYRRLISFVVLLWLLLQRNSKGPPLLSALVGVARACVRLYVGTQLCCTYVCASYLSRSRVSLFRVCVHPRALKHPPQEEKPIAARVYFTQTRRPPPPFPRNMKKNTHRKPSRAWVKTSRASPWPRSSEGSP